MDLLPARKASLLSRLCMRAHSGHSVWRTSQMAKALYGHVGGPDPRMVSEMRRLQQRVRDLEAELARLHEENDVLAAEAEHDLLIPVREPALT
jgi:cell division protein FtsB